MVFLTLDAPTTIRVRSRRGDQTHSSLNARDWSRRNGGCHISVGARARVGKMASCSHALCSPCRSSFACTTTLACRPKDALGAATPPPSEGSRNRRDVARRASGRTARDAGKPWRRPRSSCASSRRRLPASPIRSVSRTLTSSADRDAGDGLRRSRQGAVGTRRHRQRPAPRPRHGSRDWPPAPGHHASRRSGPDARPLDHDRSAERPAVGLGAVARGRRPDAPRPCRPPAPSHGRPPSVRQKSDAGPTEVSRSRPVLCVRRGSGL